MRTYRPDIDGLRALAVLPVVFYHAGFGAFSGGFVGVDVFFVISGYLITSLIYPQLCEGRFTFRDFYLRRIRRLFPALFVVVLACLIPAYGLLLPHELEDFGESVASLTLFASNFLFWSEAGYFATTAELKPLLHTWSLAIEEQYYLLFPLLLLGVIRWRPSAALSVTAVVFVASLLLAAIMVYSHPEATFYLLPARTWELLLGSLLAMSTLQIPTRWAGEVSAMLGVGLITLAVFTFDAATPFPGLSALLPCVGTALVISAGSNRPTFVTRILACKPLVFIGLISYSLYLWHWPILVFAKHYYVTELNPQTTYSLLAMALLLSILSWRFVEQPVRRRRDIFTTTRLFRAAGVMMIALIVVGLSFDASEGLPERLPENVLNILAAAEDKPNRQRDCEGQAPEHLNLQQLCGLGSPSDEPSYLLWGDSHANMLAPALHAHFSTSNQQGRYAVANGCVPLLGVERVVRDTDVACKYFNQAVFQLLEDNPNIHTVILAARWGLHASGQSVALHAAPPRYLKSSDQQATNPGENAALFKAAFVATIQKLNAMHRKVIVLGPLPEAPDDVPVALAKATWRQVDAPLGVATANFMRRQAPFFGAISQAGISEQIQLIPLHTHLCDAQMCSLVSNGQPLYFDDNHLATAGVARIQPALLQIGQSQTH